MIIDCIEGLSSLRYNVKYVYMTTLLYLFILHIGRPVKFSDYRDADDSHTIRKRMPIPFQ